MSEPAKAVFLSYAREDAGAVKHIADALRAFGIEVWFDQEELHGGDAWDAKIRGQIKSCALFIPIVSACTEERTEGYFRREWKFAVDRSHDMAGGRAFIVPVAIDDTPEADAAVPEEFMRVQWTRLPGGTPTPEFVAQVKRLLDGPKKPALKTENPRPTSVPPVVAGVGDPARPASARPATKKAPLVALAIGILGAGMVVAVLLVLIYYNPRGPEAPAAPGPKSQSQDPGRQTPDPSNLPKADSKSVAVLPFANLSAEKDNEFFADGVHEDVITSLAKIRDLKVISRTSVLAYRDTSSRNLRKIAAELGVANILEGSVRRAGNKIRVTAQLIDAHTDEHLWAETYDGDADDIFALQAKLAQQIAASLKANLTAGEKALIERRPTQDQVAYDLFLQGRILKQGLSATATREIYEPIIDLYERAVARDPAFAYAQAQLSIVHGTMYWFGAVDPSPERRAKAQAAMEAARRIAPDAPETHYAQGAFAYLCENDWDKALKELSIAEAALPNDAELQYRIAITLRRLGRWPEALGRIERCVALNPLDRSFVTTLLETNSAMRRYAELPALAARYVPLFPGDGWLKGFGIKAQFALDGDRAAYLREMGMTPPVPADKHGLQWEYAEAMRSGDFNAAEAALADPRLKAVSGLTGGVLALPPSYLRAQVALLRKDASAAKARSAEARAHFEAGPWSPRQQRLVNLELALLRTITGGADPADIMAQLDRLESYDRLMMAAIWSESARVLAVTGHREEALTCLRRLLAGPSVDSPNELRDDPFFTSFKGDPRFEEILRSAKPL
ncbi:MAG TPA: TIR domain-containing protein [Lacunisphaera sp.]|nr:TIR domain-containing protein [Lacunisphaera sp.]